MSQKTTKYSAARTIALLAILPAATLLTGCQVEMGGVTLPSPWYLTDDPQYYAPGSEFKLQREATALKEQSEAFKSQHQGAPGH